MCKHTMKLEALAPSSDAIPDILMGGTQYLQCMIDRWWAEHMDPRPIANLDHDPWNIPNTAHCSSS